MDTDSNGDSYRTEPTIFNSDADGDTNSNTHSDANSDTHSNADNDAHSNVDSTAKLKNTYKASI